MIVGAVLARSGEGWKSGPIGLAVILVLCIACYFLFTSMSRHMRKVRESFPDSSPTQVNQPAGPPPADRPPVDGLPADGLPADPPAADAPPADLPAAELPARGSSGERRSSQ